MTEQEFEESSGEFIYDIYENKKGYMTFVKSGTSGARESAKTDVKKFAEAAP